MEQQTTLCSFEHPGFAALGTPVFRLTRDDRVPALALRIDNADVIVPLRAVAQLFGIKPESNDGKMLNLIEQSLRFVSSLHVGDALPSEVLTGEASWEPREYHRRAATAKLQLQLVRWIGGAGDIDEANITPQMLIVAADDPAVRPRVEEGLRRAAASLGISGGGAAVAALIEDLAGELSYFEALREWLLDRACAMSRRVTRLSLETPSLGAGRRETLVQVVRLAATAATDLSHRFEEIEGQTANVLDALKNLERQRMFLRPHRDRLYSTLLGWEALLNTWDTFPSGAISEKVADSYRFLAPRYMTVQEWQSTLPTADRTERAKATLVW